MSEAPAAVAVGEPAADPTSNGTSNGAASTQRQRLRERRAPTTAVAFPRDPVEHARLTRELTDALIERQRNPRASADAVLAARAALEALDVEVFVVRTIPPPEWQALVELHPPTDEQAGKGEQVNMTTFRPAVLAACIVAPAGEAPYTEQEWVEFAADGRVSFGEQDVLVSTAVMLNTRAVQLDPGKAWTATRS